LEEQNDRRPTAAPFGVFACFFDYFIFDMPSFPPSTVAIGPASKPASQQANPA